MLKIWWCTLCLLAAASASGGEKLLADFGNHLIPQDTECGKRANAILARYQEKLIGAVSFGLPTMGPDGAIDAKLMQQREAPLTRLPPDVVQIIRLAPRLDGKFRDVYVVCGSGRVVFSDRGGVTGEAIWYGPVDPSELVGNVPARDARY